MKPNERCMRDCAAPSRDELDEIFSITTRKETGSLDQLLADEQPALLLKIPIALNDRAVKTRCRLISAVERIICLMVRRSVAVIVYPLLLAAVAADTAAQKTPEKLDANAKTCAALHAGIRAQIIPPYTETPSVMLSFLLLNDSETPVDVDAGSWKIVVNGGELNDSGYIFGNGPHPIGGFRVLNPGESYEFAAQLPIVKYFLPNGQYRVSWKGAAFQSPTITVTITPDSH